MRQLTILFACVLFFTGCSGSDSTSEGNSGTEASEENNVENSGSSDTRIEDFETDQTFVEVTYFTGPADDLVAFGQPVEAEITDNVEIGSDRSLPYTIDISEKQILISWSDSEEVDSYEGVVPDGETQTLVFNFTEPILEGLTPVSDEEANLQPSSVSVESAAELLVEFGGGTETGDGFESIVVLQE